MFRKIEQGLNDEEIENYISNKIKYLIELADNGCSKKQISKELKILDDAFSKFTMKDKEKFLMVK